jgi:hypothetical protein
LKDPRQKIDKLLSQADKNPEFALNLKICAYVTFSEGSTQGS